MKKKIQVIHTYDKRTIELPVINGSKDVFISYKRNNAPYVSRLVMELKTHGIETWFDLGELHYDVGKDYADRIHNGIKASDLFLLMYTKDIEKSDFIINEELDYAIKNNKKILFYPQEPIDLVNSRIRPYIEKIQWLDTKESAKFQLDTQETIHDETKIADLSKMINLKRNFSIFEDENLFLIRVALQRELGRTTIFGNYRKLCGVDINEFYTNNTLQLKVINKALFIDVPQKFYKQLFDLKFFRKDKLEEVENHLKLVNPNKEELYNTLVDFISLKKNKMYTLENIHSWLSSHLSDLKYKQITIPCVKEFSIERFLSIVAEMVACNFIYDINCGKTMFNGAELGVYNISDGRTINSESPIVEMELYYSDYFTFKCMTELFHILCSIDDAPFDIKGVKDIKPLAPFLCSLGLGGFIASYAKTGVSLMWTKRSDNISSGDMWHFSYDETVSLLLDAAKDANGHIVIGEDQTVHIDIEKILFRALKEEIGATRDLIEEDNHGLFEVGVIKSERLEIELISQAILRLPESPSLQEQIREMHDSANDGYLEISKIQFFPLRNNKDLIGKSLTPESYEICKRMQRRLKDNVGKKVHIGSNTIIEENCFIDDNATIGDYCKIHRNVYIGKNVVIGNQVKIQNNVSVYEGVTLEDGVFVGTNVTFTNDRYPRAIRKSDSMPVTKDDWTLETTTVCYGASIGAGATIRCGVTIGEWSMVGCGAVVLEDVAPGTTVVGNPAKPIKTEKSDH